LEPRYAPPALTRRRRIETAIAALLAATTVVIAATRPSETRVLGPKHLVLERIAIFRDPVNLTQPPGGSALLFVVERHGAIRIVENGVKLSTPFLDIRNMVRSKGIGQGLMSMAFAPDYDKTGRFYVSFTDRSGNLRVVEFTRSAHSQLLADPKSARNVLLIPESSPKDHGGQIVFGPDGHLYIGTGDGSPANDPLNTAQDLGSLLGKILRIDPAQHGSHPYTVPADNPFVGRRGRDEIYAYGLRNPYRFSFDRATGGLTIGDVGQDRFEEIDIVPPGSAAGANFGWPAYEGFGKLKGGVPKRATVLPVLAYPHGPGCAVIGGYVVRDPRLASLNTRQLVGRYLFGDYCTGKLSSLLRPDAGHGMAHDHPVELKVPRLTSFGEDTAGHIYVLSGEGPVYGLVATRHG
jgi:glucose/arabinose dehydrogenase